MKTLRTLRTSRSFHSFFHENPANILITSMTDITSHTKKLKKSQSFHSFFFESPTKPLISSYGKYLEYCSKNNIVATKSSRLYALRCFLTNTRI